MSQKDPVIGEEWIESTSSIVANNSYRRKATLVITAVDLANDKFSYQYLGEKATKTKTIESLKKFCTPKSAIASKAASVPVAVQKPDVTNSFVVGSTWVGTKSPMKVGKTLVITAVDSFDVHYQYTDNAEQSFFHNFNVFLNCAEKAKNSKVTATDKQIVDSAKCLHFRTAWCGDQQYCKDCGDDLLKIVNNPYAKDPDLDRVVAYAKKYG